MMVWITVGAVIPRFALLAKELVIFVLIVSSHICAVELLLQTERDVGARIWLDTFIANYLSFL